MIHDITFLLVSFVFDILSIEHGVIDYLDIVFCPLMFLYANGNKNELQKIIGSGIVGPIVEGAPC